MNIALRESKRKNGGGGANISSSDKERKVFIFCEESGWRLKYGALFESFKIRTKVYNRLIIFK